MPEVFISYAKPAATVPELAGAPQLREALEVAGITSFCFAIDLRTSDHLSEQIADSLLACKVFVAFVGPGYFDSDPCRWEWTAALTPWELATAAGGERAAADALASIVIARASDRNDQDVAGLLDAARRSGHVGCSCH